MIAAKKSQTAQSMAGPAVWRTDQTECYDSQGSRIPCRGTGQDGDLGDGMPWPEPRFISGESTVMDRLTGLMWPRSASLSAYPVTWDEALEEVAGMNRDRLFGYSDWRLPERCELFSLISHRNVNPALPDLHPFMEVFTGYYWTATPSSRLPLEAWYVHLGGGRVFLGMKHGSYMLWPVRRLRHGDGRQLPDEPGRFPDMGSDPKPDKGFRRQTVDRWSIERWECSGNRVIDHASNLMWWRHGVSNGTPVAWDEAFDMVRAMNRRTIGGFDDWHLPNVRQIASLVNPRRHTPALSEPFGDADVQPGCWASTSSALDPSYAWVLYPRDGALGVGYKVRRDFQVLAVRRLNNRMRRLN